jgi:hypothetical protein
VKLVYSSSNSVSVIWLLAEGLSSSPGVARTGPSLDHKRRAFIAHVEWGDCKTSPRSCVENVNSSELGYISYVSSVEIVQQEPSLLQIKRALKSCNNRF